MLQNGQQQCCLYRVNSYISNGWATENLVNPDGCETHVASTSVTSEQLNFTGTWVNIKAAYSQPEDVPSFNHGHMISYFVSRTAADGLPSSDIKSINKAAKHLYDCGHIQNVEVGSNSNALYIRAACIPEMRKDRIYKLIMSLDLKTFDVTAAVCGCPAGKGPSASCKHIGALSYALVEFCTSGKLPDFLTCTEKLQAWNKPKPKKVDPIPVEEFSQRKSEITKKEVKMRIGEYDPRPTSIQTNNPALLENLRVTLLQSNCSSAFLQLLVAPKEVVLHDHTYCCSDNKHSQQPPCHSELSEENDHSEIQIILDSLVTPIFTKESLVVTPEERVNIEKATKEQAKSHFWYLVRARRITGSACGKILHQQDMTTALLKSVLYPKPFIHLPPPIKWGIDNEPIANKEYIKYAKAHGKTKLTTSRCGFVIHPTMGWFGASPDAFVTDPHSNFSNGIAEFKCPYSKREMTPRDACQDSSFYCSFDGNLHLKRNHHYYHQVQLQLFVGMDMYDWCDFCVYTPKGIEVERIWLDIEWHQKYVVELDSYYDAYLLPEIMNPLHKPSYVW